MAARRVTLLYYGNDEVCKDTIEFIQEAGVVLDVRDIGKHPLSENELKRIVGHLQVKHFINNASPAFARNKLGDENLSRNEIISLLVEDHTLIKRPIVQTTRLTLVGPDKRKIADMLQLNSPDISAPEIMNNHSNQRKSRRTSKSA